MNNSGTTSIFQEQPTSQTTKKTNLKQENPANTFSENTVNVYCDNKPIKIAEVLDNSTVTAIVDPWLLERNNRKLGTTMTIYQHIIGRHISRSEALKISQEILEKVKKERLKLIELEASQWEE